jgi:hypothetical protein
MPSIGRDILPSHLDVHETPRYHDGDVFNNTRLRMGEVQEIVYPNEAKSLSKKFVEYSVYVQHRSRTGTSVGKMYNHCVLVSTFGGVADQFHFMLRADTTPSTKKKGSNGLGLGSKVLLLCINGEHSNAVILGGLRDQSEKKSGFGDKEAKDLGHYAYFNFNGVAAYIDNDGQFLLSYNGKTKVDGTTDVDKKSRGTRMAFLKDGSWNINTRDPNDPENNQEQFIFLDHANHNTVHQAKDSWTLQVGGPAKVKADSGLKVGDATDHMLLGESFRQEQKAMHSQLKNLLQQAAVQLNSAGINMGTPISGAVQAGPQIVAAANLILAAANVIDAFEQKASAKNSFLSQNNQSD